MQQDGVHFILLDFLGFHSLTTFLAVSSSIQKITSYCFRHPPPSRCGMAPKWECTKCLEDNSDSEEVCEFCDTARDDADPARLAQKAAEEREAGKEAARGDEPQPARERFTASPPTGGYAPFPPKPPRENLRFSGEDHRADAEADRAAAQWAQERRTRLLGELLIVDFCGGSERRTRLRALQLELHPDKHDRARQPYAQEMFLLVQSRWEEDEKGRKQRKQAEARRQEEQQAEEERQRQREAAREAAKAREAALRRQRDVEEAEQKRRLDAARAAAEREEARRRAEEEAEAQEASDQAPPRHGLASCVAPSFLFAGKQ